MLGKGLCALPGRPIYGGHPLISIHIVNIVYRGSCHFTVSPQYFLCPLLSYLHLSRVLALPLADPFRCIAPFRLVSELTVAGSVEARFLSALGLIYSHDLRALVEGYSAELCFSIALQQVLHRSAHNRDCKQVS